MRSTRAREARLQLSCYLAGLSCGAQPAVYSSLSTCQLFATLHNVISLAGNLPPPPPPPTHPHTHTHTHTQADFNALANQLAQQYPDRARLWFAYDEPLRWAALLLVGGGGGGMLLLGGWDGSEVGGR
jgi:hypothetical protein